jgi:16S rRNA (adenine1518-N6/adenine1519-N6)-dimethyltransferase
MTKTELLAVLTRLDLRPSRKLGQNFLVDPNLAAYIAREGLGDEQGNVIEIGPGTGSLTRHLLDAGNTVTAVEYDVRLAEYLQETFADNDAIRVVQADATRVNFAELVGDAPWRCISNLPYSVGSPVLGRLLELPNPPRRLTILIQKEMAERLTANPGTKIYGSLSVRVQLQYEARLARVVPPSVFWPQPEVDSAVTTLRLREDRLSPTEYRELAKLVNAGFGQRRKKLLRVLSSQFPNRDFATAFEKLGLSPDVRPERLTPGDWAALTAAVRQDRSPSC